jgi:hypothetical protein
MDDKGGRMMRDTINALGRYITRKTETYEQTDTDISLPTRTYLVILLAIILAMMYLDSFHWLNKYAAFAFELLAFTAFIVVLGVLCFVALPAILH